MTHRQERLFADVDNIVTTDTRSDTMPHKFPNDSVVAHRQERLFTDSRARELDALEKVIGNSTYAEIQCMPGSIVYGPAFLEFLLYGNDKWYPEWSGAEFLCGIDARSCPIRFEMNTYEAQAGEVWWGWVSLAYDGHLLVRGGEDTAEDIYFTIIPLTSVERVACFAAEYGHLVRDSDDIIECGLEIPNDMKNIPIPDPVLEWVRSR